MAGTTIFGFPQLDDTENDDFLYISRGQGVGRDRHQTKESFLQSLHREIHIDNSLAVNRFVPYGREVYLANTSSSDIAITFPDDPTEDQVGSVFEIIHSVGNRPLTIVNVESDPIPVLLHDSIVVQVIKELAVSAPSYQVIKDTNKRIAIQGAALIHPIGSLYIRLPGQVDPTVLFPEEWDWENVSNRYSGNFFRVEGSGSILFSENASIFDQANNVRFAEQNAAIAQHTHRVPLEQDQNGSSQVGDRITGRPSNSQFTQTSQGVITSSSQVQVSATENRPRNNTIQIWRRIT